MAVFLSRRKGERSAVIAGWDESAKFELGEARAPSEWGRFRVGVGYCVVRRSVAAHLKLCRIAVQCSAVDHSPEITVLQLPKFKAGATELMGTDGMKLWLRT
jgi:hypothetical protein